ncbi:RES family NAD+ phosphorylase [Rhizobium sp. SG741]|uniref:RES family NAD+ phosphorylase n=1 Tax=Rhizobium sp. SG741 TaxID=2587114 RepID=UPI001446412C|nr:RES family NAD+ phosphorylase [Rhizobium sp. SG741]NKJ03847.1 hypothetical protein [Rhizobium sp. SG741]
MDKDIEDRRLCTACVREPYLSALISTQGTDSQCDYCGDEDKCFEISKVCDEVHGAFKRHFSRARMEMNSYEWAMHKDSESSYDFEPAGDQTVYAIMGVADVSETVATDIQQVLEERFEDFEAAQIGETTEYDSDLHYEEVKPDDREWYQAWFSFERSLKREARFFSTHALEVLNSVFEGIGTMTTRRGGSLIVDGGPGTGYEYLYRARAFQSQAKLEAALLRPDKEIGPPPSALAASGRMNARGISAFYGATDPETAIAEVRPPVGSKVAIGKFTVIRPIRLLDLTALRGAAAPAGSFFDPKYATALSRMSFLRSLSRRMSRPVMPDDQEFEYLPTQAVADFLATDMVAPLDGIIFPSVQAGGNAQNVVLFHKASLVEKIVIPANTETSVRGEREDEDGSYPEYTVTWWLPPDGDNAPPTDAAWDPLIDMWRSPTASEDDMDFGSGRLETLSISSKDLEVRHIDAIRFDTEDYEVGFSQYKRQKVSDY